MPISFRTYAVIAIVFAGFTFLLSTFFGDDIAQWARERQAEAASKSQPVIEQVVFSPLEFLMDEDSRVPGAIVAGIAWPAVAILMFLIVLSIVILSFIDANNAITSEMGWLPMVPHFLTL